MENVLNVKIINIKVQIVRIIVTINAQEENVFQKTELVMKETVKKIYIMVMNVIYLALRLVIIVKNVIVMVLVYLAQMKIIMEYFAILHALAAQIKNAMMKEFVRIKKEIVKMMTIMELIVKIIV